MASCDRPWPPTCWYMMTSKYNHPLRPLNRPWARSFRLRTALRCFLGRHPRRSATAIIEPERVRTAMPHGETHPACSVMSGTAHTSGVPTCTGPHARFFKLAAHINLTTNVTSGTQTPPIPVLSGSRSRVRRELIFYAHELKLLQSQ